MLKKILVILLVSIIFISHCFNLVKAAYEITKADIVQIGEANYHLKYYKEEKKMSTYCTCAIVGHYVDGKFYPAYCLNRDMHGVGSVDSYTVDVDTLVENDEVWRAVKNAYPYKSASELGLDSEFDAFAVTKFAIYCLIGQADVNLYSADEEDKEGQAMLSALKRIVEIGKNGKESFSDEIEITKDGELIEDGDYYSLIYNVDAKSSISEYNIKSISGLQDGDIITDVNGNIKTIFNSGENFKIKIPKSKLNSNRDINIEIEAKLKSYPLYYGKTRISGTQNYLLTASSYQNINKTINANIKLNNGKIIVNKIDTDTKEPIPGVEFELYNSDNNFIGTYKTDSTGKIEIYDLYPGNYTLKETKANENYILDENTKYNVEVLYNKTSTLSIENKHKTGDLIVYKIDKDNNNISLGNIEFELYSTENSNLIGTYYTDANGKIEIKDLRTGEYILKETATNEWYNLAEDQDIQIKWNEKTNATVEDELKKGQIKVIKVDKENNEIKIPNVKFEVLDVNNNVLETIITDENGEAKTNKYTLRDFQKLRLREIETDEKYELNEEIREIELEANKIKEIKFENEKIKGNIKIIKTSSEKSSLANIEKDGAISGVKFEIYNEKGNIVDTISTNEDGIAYSSILEKGIYKIKEIETNKWYLIDNNYYTAEITNNHQIYELNIKNTPAKPTNEIEKIGPKKAKASDEIEYTINVKNTGNVDLDEFIWEDEIPVDYIKVKKLKLGTYNQSKLYDVYFKTNLTENYVLLFEGISTLKEEEIDFSKELADGEYITNIKIDFGTVCKGFESKDNTKIIAKINPEVKNGDIFKNRAILTSTYKGYKIEKDAKWETKIYKILPLTGM